MQGSSSSEVRALVDAYIPEFRERMLLALDELSDPVALENAVSSLEGPVRDLAEALIIGVGGGQALPERFHARVDQDGEALWLSGVLLPKVRPSRGASIDPRYYTASSWVNPAVARVRPLSEVQGSAEGEASAAPSSTQWDARIIAVLLEADPLRVTQAAELRKDDVERMVLRLGGDRLRWKLAIALARETGMARVVGGRLHGFPGTRPRSIRDPIELLEGMEALAAQALLRIVGRQWVGLDALAEALSRRCPEVLDAPSSDKARESLGGAAGALQRFGNLDAIRDTSGVQAVRLSRGEVEVPRGVVVTSDCEILVVPGALTSQEFGRFCRMATFEGGDVIYRHRLCREGIAADLAAGYRDADSWLEARTPSGLPSNIGDLIRGWTRSVQRVTLWTDVILVEEDGVLERVLDAPKGLIGFDYAETCLGEIERNGSRVEVRRNACPLGLKAALDRVLPRAERTEENWCWTLEPGAIAKPAARIEELKSRSSNGIPGALEAAIQVAGGRSELRVESAVVIHMAPEVIGALLREPRLARMLQRVVQPGQVLVAETDLAELRSALSALGLEER